MRYAAVAPATVTSTRRQCLRCVMKMASSTPATSSLPLWRNRFTIVNAAANRATRVQEEKYRCESAAISSTSQNIHKTAIAKGMSFHIAIVVKPVCGDSAIRIGVANAVLRDTPTRNRRRCKLPSTAERLTM